mgnify:CR=1 FL=1
MTAANPNWVGHELSGRYKVCKLLAKGGMSLVYLAFDSKVGREVAIKTPRPNLLYSDEFRKRFHREIRALQALTHPNLVDIFDLGEHDGMPYAVLRYLRGGTLRQRIRSNQSNSNFPLLTSPDSVLVWLPAIADALDYLHNHNYLHRDVKPENILFDQDDHPYLSDFGTIKVMCDMQLGSKPDSCLTEIGQAIGTLPYLPYEVLTRGQLSRQVDQYALAVTVYEALSGKLPYQGRNPAELVLQQQGGLPERLDRCAGVEPLVADVVEKALSLEPEKRFGSCREFAAAYANALKCRVSFADFSPHSSGTRNHADGQPLTVMEPPQPVIFPPPAQERHTPVPPATPQHIMLSISSLENQELPGSESPAVKSPYSAPPPPAGKSVDDRQIERCLPQAVDTSNSSSPRVPFSSPGSMPGISSGLGSHRFMICPVCDMLFEALSDGSSVLCPYCRAPVLVGSQAIRPTLLRRLRRRDALLISSLLTLSLCGIVGLLILMFVILRIL